MEKVKVLSSALEYIKQGLPNVQSEDELEKLFQASGFYQALGYAHVGRDIRAKRGGAAGIPDVFLLNEDESIQVVLEFKRPSVELEGHTRISS